jgi:hypothetical protein
MLLKRHTRDRFQSGKRQLCIFKKASLNSISIPTPPYFSENKALLDFT